MKSAYEAAQEAGEGVLPPPTPHLPLSAYKRRATSPTRGDMPTPNRIDNKEATAA